MKKYFIGVLACLLALGVTSTSCSSDDDNELTPPAVGSQENKNINLTVNGNKVTFDNNCLAYLGYATPPGYDTDGDFWDIDVTVSGLLLEKFFTLSFEYEQPSWAGPLTTVKSGLDLLHDPTRQWNDSPAYAEIDGKQYVVTRIVAGYWDYTNDDSDDDLTAGYLAGESLTVDGFEEKGYIQLTMKDCFICEVEKDDIEDIIFKGVCKPSHVLPISGTVRVPYDSEMDERLGGKSVKRLIQIDPLPVAQ